MIARYWVECLPDCEWQEMARADQARAGGGVMDYATCKRIPFSLAEEIADQLVDSGELRKGTDE